MTALSSSFSCIRSARTALYTLTLGALLTLFLPSCVTSPTLLAPKAPKLYPPDKLTAQIIEDIAINEVGKREIFDKLPPEQRSQLDLSKPHPELPNFRHAGVLENKDGSYLVHIEARPSRPDGRRTVIVGPRGEIVDYKKSFLYSYKAPTQKLLPLQPQNTLVPTEG